MTQKDIETVIEQLPEEQPVRVYFRNNKLPLVGIFVSDIDSKGFIRFVPLQRMDAWNKLHHIALTRMLLVSTIEYIKTTQVCVI